MRGSIRTLYRLTHNLGMLPEGAFDGIIVVVGGEALYGWISEQ